MIDRNDIAKFNTPFYKQADMNPPMAGKSVLHDPNGRPLYKPQQQEVRNDPRPPGGRFVVKGVTYPQQQSQYQQQQPQQQPQQQHPQHPQRHLSQQVGRQLNPGHSPQPPEGVPHQMPQAPPEIPVHVGNHEEHVWYNSGVPGPGGNSYLNEDYIDTNALQGHNPLEGVPHRTPEDIAREMQAEQQGFEAPGNTVTESASSNGNQSLLNIDAGQMCVMVQGDVVYVSEDIAQISKCVEDIMLEYKIPIEQIVVFKRLDLDFGIKIK